jgi:hypothetical protein
MKTKDMVNVEFSGFLCRHFFLASHEVNQLGELVNKNTDTVVTLAWKLDNKTKVTVCEGFSGIGNGYSSSYGLWQQALFL